MSQTRVVELVLQNPHVAEVLAKWGIAFCPGCFVALTSTVEQAGHYNAVKHLPDFLREVADALEASHASA